MNKGLFLRVYERRDKFQYIIKKECMIKIRNIRGLPSCVVQKFNGYDILKSELKNEEKRFS